MAVSAAQSQKVRSGAPAEAQGVEDEKAARARLEEERLIDACWEAWEESLRWQARMQEEEAWRTLEAEERQRQVEQQKRKEREASDPLHLELMQRYGGLRQQVRFHLVPRVHWDKAAQEMRCGARNHLEWRGVGPVPDPPDSGPCWLLPARDETALRIAERQDELRAAGWRLVTSAPEVVAQFINKINFSLFAERLGLAQHLPAHFSTADEARYPCILKPAVGEYGKNTEIVRCSEDIVELAGGAELSEDWVLQELIVGPIEYSTSLLVCDGGIVESACMRYTYDKDEYVWPRVGLVCQELMCAPEEHLEVMRGFLRGYSGFCNFNYKTRPSGGLCIFEVNARVGADLACEMPRDRARMMFDRFDRCFSRLV